MMLTQHEFGEKLKTFRKRRKLTQKELARKLHMTDASISKWEDGTVNPGFLNILQLCEEFGLTLDELLGLKKTKTPEHSKPCLNGLN